MQEIQKYSTNYINFQFKCEQMVYSKFFGIQGRIDRLVHDIPLAKYSIYETKTGKSPRASQMTAFYQNMAYATILKEIYSGELDKILIEYPVLVFSPKNTAIAVQIVKFTGGREGIV